MLAEVGFRSEGCSMKEMGEVACKEFLCRSKPIEDGDIFFRLENKFAVEFRTVQNSGYLSEQFLVLFEQIAGIEVIARDLISERQSRQICSNGRMSAELRKAYGVRGEPVEPREEGQDFRYLERGKAHRLSFVFNEKAVAFRSDNLDVCPAEHHIDLDFLGSKFVGSKQVEHVTQLRRCQFLPAGG